jgi:hypothetical protein
MTDIILLPICGTLVAGVIALLVIYHNDNHNDGVTTGVTVTKTVRESSKEAYGSAYHTGEQMTIGLGDARKFPVLAFVNGLGEFHWGKYVCYAGTFGGVGIVNYLDTWSSHGVIYTVYHFSQGSTITLGDATFKVLSFNASNMLVEMVAWNPSIFN